MQKSCVVKEIVVLDKTIYYYDDLIDMSAFTLPDCHWITINWLVLQQCVCIKNHCLSLEGKNNKIQPLLRKNFMQICTKFVFIRMTNIQFTFVPSSCLKIRLLYEFFNTTSSSIALPKKSKLGKNTHTHTISASPTLNSSLSNAWQWIYCFPFSAQYIFHNLSYALSPLRFVVHNMKIK